MSSPDFPTLFERVCRWYVFLFLNIYGLGKIAGGQFWRRGQLPEALAQTPLVDVSAFDLCWTFMGYSYVYIFFIGASQLLGAWMLLWNQTKLLGVAVLVPIMANIIVIDWVYLDAKGPIVNATIYFLMLLYILYYNREVVIHAFEALTVGRTLRKPWRESLWQAVLTLGLMAIIYAVDHFLVWYV
ncbi:MAG: hypothetical protein AAGJ82_02205 [Bacteroidota bacterium]